MKKCAVLLLVSAMVLSLASCGGARKADRDKIVIYTTMYEDVIAEMDKALDKAFPDLDVEFVYGGTGNLQNRVAQEMEAGKLGCDILMVADPSYSLELKDAGVLHAFDYPEKDKLLYDYDPEGCWYPVRVCTMVLAYDGSKCSAADVPSTFKGFAADKRLDGALAMGDPITSGTTYAAVVALLDKYGEDYFQGLYDLKASAEASSIALMKLLVGDCKEVMVLEESVLKKKAGADGADLEVIYPDDGVIIIPSSIMTIAGEWSANNNTAACEAIESWFLSPEGQEHIVSGWMRTVRSDVEAVPTGGIPAEELNAKVIPVDWERCYRERDAIRAMFLEYVPVLLS